MPLVATFLYYRSNEIAVNIAENMHEKEAFYGTPVDYNSALWPRLLPGLYVSALGCVSLYCLNYVVKHPHDVRVGNQKLKQQVNVVKQSAKTNKKKKKQLKEALAAGEFGNTDQGGYVSPTLPPLL